MYQTLSDDLMASYWPRTKRVRLSPSYIIFRNRRFLILESPSSCTVGVFIKELKEHNVKYVVRVCEPTYDAELLENEEIEVLDWPFRDGFPPPPRVIENWLKHVKTTFRESPESCIAVHCVAGLGRAPVLVALALIDLGMPSEDAVELIRRYRPGAMNLRQLEFLKEYESRSCFNTVGCIVMFLPSSLGVGHTNSIYVSVTSSLEF